LTKNSFQTNLNSIFDSEPQAFPDIFSVIEGETEARDQDIFTGFEDRVDRRIDEEFDRLDNSI